MLYVSRVFEDNNIKMAEVVDTDDGISEVVDRDELIQAVVVYKLDIAGVIFSFVDSKFRYTVKPYDPSSEKARLCLKTSMALGLDIVVNHGGIVSVNWENLTQPATIRLSDYGDSIACGLFRANKYKNRHKITFILDDKFEPYTISDEIFTGEVLCDIAIDLRECHQKSVVYSVYECSANFSGVGEYHIQDIIDNPDRKEELVRRLNNEYYGVDYDEDDTF